MQIPNRQLFTWRAFIGYAFIGFALYGVFAFSRWAFRLLGGLNYGAILPVTNWFEQNVLQHTDGWLTAIATALIACLTYVLARSGKEQNARDAPLVRFTLAEDGNSPENTYDSNWHQEDQSNRDLVNSIMHAWSPIRIDITNVQDRPYGVAFGVQIKTVLMWGADNNDDPHPFRMERSVNVSALGAEQAIGGPLFNVGDLRNYIVAVTEVSYRDVAGGRKRAAYGIGLLWKKLNGLPTVLNETVFEPTKREIGR